MFPVLLKTPWFTIYSYGVFLALAYLTGLELAFWKAEREDYPPRIFSNFALLAVVSAFVGSRALYVWLEWHQFAGEPWRVLAIWEGGLVFYGGLLLSLACCVPYLRHHGFSIVRVADLAMPSVAFGHAIGRLGCLGVGCCYGIPSDLPWAVHLHHLPPGATVHPVQAYASLSLFVLFALLEWSWWRHRKAYPGWVFVLYCAYQSVHRYTMELYRGDPRGGTFLFGMTISQQVAVGLGILALASYLVCRFWYWPRLRAAGSDASGEAP